MAEMIRAMTPILLANALTFLYVYGLWRLYKRERPASEPKKGLGESLTELAMVAIPPLILIYGLHLWGFTEATPFRHLFAEQQTETQAP